MRKTRLFIGHNPELTNGSLEHSVDSSNNLVMGGWNVPVGNTFETDPNTNYEFLVPYSDNANGDYAITQDIGVTGPGVVELEISVWFLGGASGLFRVQIGDAWVEFFPWLFNNVIDWHNPGAMGIITGKFVVTQPDPVFGYKLVIRGAGGGGIPGTMPVHRGLRYIKLLSYDTFYQEVDLYDELDIPVTYNVADVRDISKKDSNFSLTVSLPNTNNNAQLFDCIHEIARYGSGFEMLKQYPAYVEVDNNRTFEGYLKLTKVVIDDDKEVSYECNLYSNFIEFVKRLGTSTLRGNDNSLEDLSFSEYTTTLTQQDWIDRTDMFLWDTSTDPWTPIGDKPYGKDFYFTFIDKFHFGDRQSQLYENIPGMGDKQEVPVFFDETTPFLFYKEIWDKLFECAGFSYVSDFIEDNNNSTPFRFDHLVYPAISPIPGTLSEIYTRVVQTDASLIGVPNSTKQFYWNQNTSLPYPLDECIGYADVYENPNNTLSIQEIGNSSVFGTYYKTTINRGGLYHLNVNIPFNVWMMITDPTGQFDYSNLDTYVEMDTTVQYHIRLEFDLRRGGTTIKLGEASIDNNYESQYYAAFGRFQIYEDTLFLDRDVYAQTGDELFIKYYYDFPVGGLKTQGGFTNYAWVAKRPDPSPGIDGSPLGLRNYIQFLKTEQNTRQIDLELVSDFSIDGIFDPTVILNPKRKKVDFINDIIKKFNLYVEDVTNKKDANGVYYRDYTSPNIRRGEPILRIEPRPMYYDNQYVVKDWTNRVDTSSIEFERIDDYVYKWLDFNDKDDNTYHVTDYNGYEYTEGEYGEEKITSPMNTSADEKTEIKTSFGQTMCGPIGTEDIDWRENKYLQAPYIFTLDNSGIVKKDKEYEDRMLFVYSLYWRNFQGIFNSSPLQGWHLYRRDNSDTEAFTDTNGVLNVFTYNLLDTFNAPFGSDTADLNFGWANWYYQNLNGTWATWNNCYNVFYKDMVEEYNDPNARMMTCKMYLTPADIRDVRLSDVILVNDVAYHINKISQWKNGDEPVKVELIKIINSRSKWKPNPKGPAVRENRPPVLEYITPVKLRDDLAAVGKLVEENTEAIAGDKTAIDAILKTIANLDARLKKLEGDGGTSTDPTPGDDGSGTIKDDEEKPKDDGKTIQRQFKKEQRAKNIKDAYDRLASIPASKRKLSDYPWYQQQMRLYSGYSHTGSPISKSSNIN